MNASRRAVLALLAVAVVVGAWLRFASLGRLSPWDDEFPHLIAGSAVVDHGSPDLPSGRPYRRALAQSVAVGISMKVLGSGEAAARVPSALAGLATIPIVFVLARKRFGDAVAIAASAAVAISPLFVAHSRSARFYAAFALAYAGATWFGAHAIRTGRRAHIIAATACFLVALHLQSLALLIVLPLAADALWCLRAGTADERKTAMRAVQVFASLALAGVAAFALLAVAGRADGALRSIRLPVPGVEFAPGLRLHTLGRIFNGITPWAWVVLGPAAMIGILRNRRDGVSLLIHAALPALVLSVLYRRIGAHERGIDVRYLIHQRLLMTVVAGIGVAVIARWFVSRLKEPRRAIAEPVAAVAIAIATVAGVGGVFRIAGEPHPGRVIPRANWRAAAGVVRDDIRPGDALLTTSPLASSWFLGRCGTWLRSEKAAAPYVDGGRDVYCGSQVVSSFADWQELFLAHPRGWVLADAWWHTEVDASVRAFIDARVTRLASPDPTVRIYRWVRTS